MPLEKLCFALKVIFLFPFGKLPATMDKDERKKMMNESIFYFFFVSLPWPLVSGHYFNKNIYILYFYGLLYVRILKPVWHSKMSL